MTQNAKLSDDALLSFTDDQGSDKPIVMVNLLRFREQALYQDKPSSCSGEEAYSLYAKAVVPLILEVGGYPVWAGRVRSALIGNENEKWDQVALIAYPSRKAFVDMHLTQTYKECVTHRNAALADVRLIETKPIYFPRLIVRCVGLVFRLKNFIKPRAQA